MNKAIRQINGIIVISGIIALGSGWRETI